MSLIDNISLHKIMLSPWLWSSCYRVCCKYKYLKFFGFKSCTEYRFCCCVTICEIFRNELQASPENNCFTCRFTVSWSWRDDTNWQVWSHLHCTLSQIKSPHNESHIVDCTGTKCFGHPHASSSLSYPFKHAQLAHAEQKVSMASGQGFNLWLKAKKYSLADFSVLQLTGYDLRLTFWLLQ